MVCIIRPARFQLWWVFGWAADGDANGGVMLKEFASFNEAYASREILMSGQMTLWFLHGDGHLAIINHQGTVLWSEKPQPGPLVEEGVAVTLEQEVA